MPKTCIPQQKRFDRNDQKSYTSALGGRTDITELAERILGRPRPGDTLLYLVRRFGYTCNGSDAHKGVCDYILTTPDPDVMLDIRIKADRVDFAAYLEESLSDRAAFAVRDPADETLKRIHAALAPTLTALLEPVLVRDNPINLHGVCAYPAYAPPRPASAGCGVPPRFLDSPGDVHRLLVAVEKVGGVDAALERLNRAEGRA